MEQKIYSTLEKAKNSIAKYDSKNIFLVTGKDSFEKSGAKDRLENLISNNYTRYHDFSSNPKFDEVLNGVDLLKKSEHELILAIGGGSVIDMAKMIKGLAYEENPRQSVLENKTSSTDIPIIAVPTTSGSGSESTPFAVVYLDGIKYSLQHGSLLPEKVVLDPMLTRSMSPKQTAVTGMDALSQAIESYWSVNSTEESKKYSREAIPLILKNLESAVHGQNDQNREAMMKAANLAGKAIAISKTTSCHAISYPITSNFDIPHGHAAALTLGEVFEYNSKLDITNCTDKRGVEYVKQAMVELTKILEVTNPEQAKEKIKSLMNSIGLETKFSDLQITDTETIIKEGFNPQRMINNPRIVEKKDLREILESIS